MRKSSGEALLNLSAEHVSKMPEEISVDSEGAGGWESRFKNNSIVDPHAQVRFTKVNIMNIMTRK